MLRVDSARWGRTAEDLRHLAMSAPHARTRERALALYEITQGCCATRVPARSGRHPQTIMGWVHAYNAQGPDALAFRRTGADPLYRSQIVRHRIGCYAARAASESWFCRTAAGVWNPCRSMSQVVL